MGSKGKLHLGLEEGATAAGQESRRLLGPGRICLWDFTSQDELPPGIRKGEQWGVNGKEAALGERLQNKQAETEGKHGS